MLASTYPLFLCLGALGLGFVFGWTLYFANRGKAGKLTMSDIAAMIAAVAGGGVVSFFSTAPDAAAKAAALGFYGIGVFIGFVIYFVLYRSALKKDGAPDAALISVSSVKGTRKSALISSFEAEDVFAARTMAARDPEQQAALDALDELKRKAKALHDDLAQAYEEANGDDAKQAKIALQIARLNRYRADISLSSATVLLQGAHVQAFFDALDRETTALKTEAQKMKDAAKTVSKVTDLLSAADGLIAKVRDLI